MSGIGRTADATDVALGLTNEGDLAGFAADQNALTASEWTQAGLMDANVGSFEVGFHQTVGRALARGGRIKFNLTGMKLDRAVRFNRGPCPSLYDEAAGIGYTEWELQQIARDRYLWERTDFFLDGEQLTLEKLAEFGIRLMASE